MFAICHFPHASRPLCALRAFASPRSSAGLTSAPTPLRSDADGACAMKTLVQYGAVAGAGALGAMLRMFVGAVCGRVFGTSFPVGTLLINLGGSFFLGWFIAVRGRGLFVSETVYAA